MAPHSVAGPQVGVLDDVLTNVHNVVRKGRLGPGQMISANLVEGVFKESVQIAREVSTAQPYREWLASSSRLADLAPPGGYLEEPQMGAAEVGRPVLTCDYYVRATSWDVSPVCAPSPWRLPGGAADGRR